MRLRVGGSRHAPAGLGEVWSSRHPLYPHSRPPDEWLFGWDSTPGIVSVWATRRGRALVWQRAGATVRCTATTFRPWLFAASLADLQPLGSACVPEAAADSAAPFRYRVLAGAGDATYPYLLSARPGQDLEQAILTGAAARLDRPVRRLAELGDAYYAVGPVEQYLMQTGQVYFRGPGLCRPAPAAIRPGNHGPQSPAGAHLPGGRARQPGAGHRPGGPIPGRRSRPDHRPLRPHPRSAIPT